ncbi:MAG: hypothetical protein EBR82_57710 [Caulobacteraceae bacterium]|nr:hypothetical protein [Caulobacteraceae bacterium]
MSELFIPKRCVFIDVDELSQHIIVAKVSLFVILEGPIPIQYMPGASVVLESKFADVFEVVGIIAQSTNLFFGSKVVLS